MESDPAANLETLGLDGELGERLTIAAFGSAYSSLAHQRVFPINKLQVDRPLLSALANDTETTTPSSCTPSPSLRRVLARTLPRQAAKASRSVCGYLCSGAMSGKGPFTATRSTRGTFEGLLE